MNAYDVLGLKKDATLTDIKKAFHEKALIHHPDKPLTGNRAKYDQVKNAYDSLISGAGQKQEHEEPRKEKKLMLPVYLEVPLNILYSGGIVPTNISYASPCQQCARPPCSKCEIKMVTIQVPIKAGANRGHIIFVDDHPTLIFRVSITPKRHQVFSLYREHDLHMNLTITLQDSLLGFEQVITTLDDRQIIIKNIIDVIKPGSTMRVIGEGMPYCESQIEKKGDLYITFQVEFPNRIDEATRNGLIGAWGYNYPRQVPARDAQSTKLLQPL